jgi:group II intron reverse transcriptase/maturase
VRFTALLHHVNIESLERSYDRLRQDAASGVDGETASSYGEKLEDNLGSLCARVHRGSYRPRPVRRVMIPKADGGERPLGIPALEDKIVQGAVAELLSAIYEVDFADFSYGFRPGRSAHDALEALNHGMRTEHVNWVLDADIRKFFDSVDHELLMRCVERRIGDRRVLRLLEQWLSAGVMANGEWQASELGTPQGSVISPLLANIFLHYALDAWFTKRKQESGRGRMFMVRYADDFVMCFQFRADAEEMLAALGERLRKCRLELHEGKTRLIEFGRYAPASRAKRGEGKPETFNFLGFTHYMGKTRSGGYTMKRKTQSGRLTRKLRAVRERARKMMHRPVPEQHAWLRSVLLGHYRYYGVHCNFASLQIFWDEVRRIWYRVLRRRDRKRALTWDRYDTLLIRFPLPKPKLLACRAQTTSSLG